MADRGLPLLNVYEINDAEGAPRHLIAFVDTVRAGASGLDPRSVVGDFTPGADGGFSAQTFRINPEFVRALASYMDEVVATTSGVIRDANDQPSGWLYLIDPRADDEPEEDDPDPGDVLGCFAVDDSGQIVPKSFQYNTNHNIFSDDSGVSGLFSDRSFYDWLHPDPPSRRPRL